MSTPRTIRDRYKRDPEGWSDGRNHYIRMPDWGYWVNTSTGERCVRRYINGHPIMTNIPTPQTGV